MMSSPSHFLLHNGCLLYLPFCITLIKIYYINPYFVSNVSMGLKVYLVLVNDFRMFALGPKMFALGLKMFALGLKMCAEQHPKCLR
ncbi:hypothetical protein BDQ17DRAFT_688341 [Cyathus striatus]|nr:hypothetical protein BDQ17DRAFT_688341 [Cyathus striatus]